MNFKFPDTKVAAKTLDASEVDFSSAKVGGGSGLPPAGAPPPPVPDDSLEVSSKEEVEAAMARLREGEPLEYSTERVARFMSHEIAELCKPESAPSYAYPIAVFLPGTVKPDWGARRPREPPTPPQPPVHRTAQSQRASPRCSPVAAAA